MSSLITNQAKRPHEKPLQAALMVVSLLPLVILVAITLVLFYRAMPMLRAYPLAALLTGTIWKPQQGQFGFLPFISGTFWVTVTAVMLALPLSLLAALYISEYAKPALTALIKPVLDLLAAIPSVVYGVWGVLVIVPWVEDGLLPLVGRLPIQLPFLTVRQSTGFSVLAAGIVLAVMIIPFIIAVMVEVMATIAHGAKLASLGLGATRWQTIVRVVLPQSISGILAAVVLGASRALGETMAVLMVAGNVVQLPGSIFDAAYTLPALIANNYGEMMSIPLYDAALLCAALLLLVIILGFNVASTLVLQQIIRRRQ